MERKKRRCKRDGVSVYDAVIHMTGQNTGVESERCISSHPDYGYLLNCLFMR